MLFILTGCIGFVACKKEPSCEGCADNNKNKPPIAVAGPDQVITLPTDSVWLDGRTSSDPDGVISSYLWTKISGPVSFNIVKPSDSITKIKALVVGSYQFELKVTDDSGLSAKDTVSVIVDPVITTNHPPIADAGPDQIITLPTNTVTLDGSRSTDPDNNITGYAWAKITGPSSFAIANASLVHTQVGSLIQGIYQFQLKVTDAGGLFSKDTINITVNSSSPPPPPPVNCNPGNRPLIPAQLIPIGTLSQTRSALAIGAAGNKIVFAGGWIYPGNDVPSSTRIDIYDITTGTWTTAELSAGRFGSGVAVIGNKIFFGGGGVQQNNGWGAWQYSGLGSSAVDIYDASTNLWSTAQLSSPRCPTGASAGNKLIFFGGDDMYPSSRVDIYDEATNLWTNTLLSESRHINQAAIAGNKIFLAGGSSGLFGSGGNSISKKIDVFDAASATWSIDFLSIERGVMGSISGNNKIYWGGGAIVSTNGTEFNVTSSVEIRDLATNTASFSCLSEPKLGLTALSKDNKIVFYGGSNHKFDIYDLTTDTWSIGVLPLPIIGGNIVSYNNVIYIAGAELNGAISNQVWKLDF